MFTWKHLSTVLDGRVWIIEKCSPHSTDYRTLKDHVIVAVGTIVAFRLCWLLDFGHREGCFPTAERPPDRHRFVSVFEADFGVNQ
ncbi:hypothetical protein Q31b_37500 [Novipirellula aureliae]|uniref:Uncharacterized protein n=1 Tax=Novipirellula aureliae TaxID=2527966 RepID=A0A5C6DPY1_9BACT|nr:hypothetical protein Q31b_37500 [Novipirellula aureliae]